MSRFVLAAIVALGLSACSDDPDEVTPDSGTSVDAGTNADAGADAGTNVDAGVDAGAGSSQGSGKLGCTSTGSVKTDAGTLSYCVAKVGDTEMKIIEPQGGIAP